MLAQLFYFAGELPANKHFCNFLEQRERERAHFCDFLDALTNLVDRPN